MILHSCTKNSSLIRKVYINLYSMERGLIVARAQFFTLLFFINEVLRAPQQTTDAAKLPLKKSSDLDLSVEASEADPRLRHSAKSVCLSNQN